MLQVPLDHTNELRAPNPSRLQNERRRSRSQFFWWYPLPNIASTRASSSTLKMSPSSVIRRDNDSTAHRLVSALGKIKEWSPPRWYS